MRGRIRLAAAAAVVMGAALSASAGAAAARPALRPADVVFSTSAGLQRMAPATSALTASIHGFVGGSIVVTPDGRTAFTASDTQVTSANLTTNTAGPAVTGLTGWVTSIALSPDGATLYVTTDEVSPPDPEVDLLYPVNVATRVAGTPIVLPDYPRNGTLAITPDGAKAYIGAGYSVLVVDLKGHAPITTIPVSRLPASIAITPDGTTAWVALSVGGLVPITVATGAVGTPIPIPDGGPSQLAISPTGVHAYVTLSRTSDVVPIDLVSRTARPAVSVSANDPTSGDGLGVAFTPDGKRAFIADRFSAFVRPIGVATNAVGTAISAANLAGIALTPDQPPVAALKITLARAGKATTLDARGSYGQTSPIASYVWRFGDGTGASTTTGVVKHVYKRAGKHVVSVRVVDGAGTSTTRVFTGQMVSRNGSAVALVTRTIAIAK